MQLHFNQVFRFNVDRSTLNFQSIERTLRDNEAFLFKAEAFSTNCNWKWSLRLPWAEKKKKAKNCNCDYLDWSTAAMEKFRVEAVVVAQAVERQHSVRKGWVHIPGCTWFFWFRIAVNLFSFGIGLCLRTCNRTMHTPSSSSFLFPITLYHCKLINCNPTMYNEKENESKRKPGKANIKKRLP